MIAACCIFRYNVLMSEIHQNNALEAALSFCSTDVHPMVYEMLDDPKLLSALPEQIKRPEVLALYLEHTSRFAEADKRKFLKEEVTLPRSQHADGRTRREETGQRVDTEELRKMGIDPAYVLYFRVTQPSDTPNPEYYRTSDLTEVRQGLTQEITEKARSKSVILCSTLEDIASDAGVMTDVNDDNGIAVRTLYTGDYDQQRALAVIRQEAKDNTGSVRSSTHLDVQRLFEKH